MHQQSILNYSCSKLLALLTITDDIMRIYCTGHIYVTYHKSQFTDKVICNL